ncbi:MAG: hypothetical protein J6T55_04220 [Alphaproteobacteria bacterium]|nr:hypothetical protein [Alphaproteobacteria bacterium]
MHFKILTLLASGLLLAACGVGDKNTTYERGQIGQQGQLFTGKIISMTQVDIAGTSENGGLAGAVVGGALGGVGGSAIGGGKGSALMAIGGAAIGALAGAAAGSAAEQAATSDTAYEFFVRKDETGRMISVVQTNELGLQPGDNVILIENKGVTRIRKKY